MSINDSSSSPPSPPSSRPLQVPVRDYQRMAALEDSSKAAILVLAMGNHQAEQLIKNLNDTELQKISQAIAVMGRVDAEVVEDIVLQFVQKVTTSADLSGSYAVAEKLLRRALPQDRAEEILAQIRTSHSGVNMWEQLSHVSPDILAGYLSNEYPQTIALILSKINPQHASRVMSMFPDTLNLEVMNRIIKLENVQSDVIKDLQETLENEFVKAMGKGRQRDTHEVLADIFNNFDRATETRLMALLDEQDNVAAQKVKALMFTFDDLVRIENEGVQILVTSFPRDSLAVALKSASQRHVDLFLRNMSDRAARVLREDMAAMGEVRLRKVEEAQQALVALAKELVDEGAIDIASRGQESNRWVV